MNKALIIVNTVIRNEECWVWYAIKSVVPYVDKILVWDTGSKDNTVSEVTSIRSSKITFKSVPLTPDETALSKTRQQMLKQTHANWLMILDGDEVWPEDSLQKIIKFISEHGDLYDSIVVPTLNCVGDIYHTSSPNLGRYKIAGHVGHFNLRFINLRRVKGLHVDNPPGKLQSYFDGRNIRIQDRNPNAIAFLDAPYMHMTHLVRSHQRQNETNVYWRATKKRVESGVPLPNGFKFPKVFNLVPPAGAANPWRRRSVKFNLSANLIQPIRILKHLLI